MKITKLNTLTKVNDSITLYRYDNGWMVEVGGRNKDNDWKNTKTVCNSETELKLSSKRFLNLVEGAL